MSYAAIAVLAADPGFVARIGAALVKETGEADPARIASLIAAKVASAPGFAEKFVWGDRDAGIEPGQAAIADADLYAAIAAALPTP